MNEEAIRARIAPLTGEAKHLQAGLLLELIADGRVPPLDHAEERRWFNVDCARAANCDLDIVHGAPAIVLTRHRPAPGKTAPVKGTEWTGIGDYTTDVQAIIRQLLLHGRAVAPGFIQLSMVVGKQPVWEARVGDKTDSVNTGAATEGLALLMGALRWHMLLIERAGQ